MNGTYSSYLESAAWMEKRVRRVALSKHRCEACGAEEQLQVHHLTYARIFREEMEDLMTLCAMHHEAIEELTRKGIVTRTGRPADLRRQTLRFIGPVPRQERKAFRALTPKTEGLRSLRDPKMIRRRLMESTPFLELLGIKDRNRFKKAARKMFKTETGKTSGRIMANAIILYDRPSFRTE